MLLREPRKIDMYTCTNIKYTLFIFSIVFIDKLSLMLILTLLISKERSQRLDIYLQYFMPPFHKIKVHKVANKNMIRYNPWETLWGTRKMDPSWYLL